MSNKAKTLLVPKLRFPEFRDGPPWESRGLGPMTLKVGSGITPTGGDKNYKAKGRPFVRSQNVGWGELILDDVAYIDEEMHQSFDATEIATSDVLLNITGASIGRSAVADSRIAAGNVNQHVCIIRVKPNELNPFLLNQYLISQYGQRQIDSFQAGGNRQGLNFAQIRSFLIPLSQALPEQQKIADCLSSLDELIAAQARKVDALKTHKKGLMQQLFPREGETQPHLRFPEFQHAEAWGMCELGSASDVRDGTHDSPKFFTLGRPLVTSKNLRSDGTLDLENVSLISEQDYEQINKRSKVSVGDILFGMIGTIGNPVLIKSEGFSIKNVALIKQLGPLLNSFLVQLLQSDYVAAIFAVLNTGNSQKFIALGKIRSLPVPIPSLLEQHRIADCLTSLDTLVTAATQDIETLKTHKKGLMQQLFPMLDEGRR